MRPLIGPELDEHAVKLSWTSNYFRGLFVRPPLGQSFVIETDRAKAMKRCGTLAIFVVVVSVGWSVGLSGRE